MEDSNVKQPIHASLRGAERRSNPDHQRWEVLDCFAGARNDGSLRCTISFSQRRRVRVLQNNVPLKNRGRRECRVLQPTPTASRANERSTRAVVTTDESRITGIPCAMVLRFPSRSPRRPGFVASVVGAMQSILAYLTPALVCQDHTTSPSARNITRQSMCRVHRIPRPTLVTIAKRPSYRARDGASL